MSPKLHNTSETGLILEYMSQAWTDSIFQYLWFMERHITLSEQPTVWSDPSLQLFPTVIINSSAFHSQKCPSLDKKVYGHPASLLLATVKHVYPIQAQCKTKMGGLLFKQQRKSTIKGAENTKSFFLHVSALLTLHCPTELHLQKTS